MVYKFVYNTNKPFMKLQSDDSVNVVVCGILSLLWISQLIKSIAGVINDILNNRILTPLRIQRTIFWAFVYLCVFMWYCSLHILFANFHLKFCVKMFYKYFCAIEFCSRFSDFNLV